MRPEKIGQLVQLVGAPNDNSTDYERIRIQAGLPEGQELVNRIPLECNLDLLGYICFTKGCYLGQELTARTKYQVHRIVTWK